jgi:diguanylate cyclase (GGDEF)-like protein/PAS domain S-box-containing protein
MAESPRQGDNPDEAALKNEIVRQAKIIRVLMDRAERSTSVQGSDFSLFQTAVMLEEQVRSRTAELEAALRENEKITRALRESEGKFHGLVNQSLVGIFIIEDGKFNYTNVKFNEIFGYNEEEIADLDPVTIIAESGRLLVMENIRKHWRGELEQMDSVLRGVRKNGEIIHVEFHTSAMNFGRKQVLISLVMDVTARIHAECEMQSLQDKLREQSTHDALTGLYNRRYLEETLGRELLSAERHGHAVSVIMGDLDYFKMVNDRYGHLAGDEVLRTFGALLKKNARGSDVYCRYGGEEFLLVLPLMTQGSAMERAEQLRGALEAAPVPYGASLIPVTASFGVATFPHNGRTGDELIAAADHALYAAKEGGRNRVNASAKQVRP